MAYEWHRPLELRWVLFTVLSALAVVVGGLVLLIPPFFIQGTIQEVPGIRPYAALELEGRDLYIREGCSVCHSQMIRPLRTETARYGDFTLAGEGIYERPFLYGSRRTGPDISRIGGKYPDSWHWLHFENPRNIEPRSNMPDFAFLMERELDTSLTSRRMEVLRRLGHPYSDEEIANAVADLQAHAARIVASLRKDGIGVSESQAKSEVIAMIAYMQALGRGYAEGKRLAAATEGER